MPPPHSADENENHVIASNSASDTGGKVPANGGNSHLHLVGPQSLDTCSLTMTSTENTVLSEDEEDPVTIASTRLASSTTPSSAKHLTSGGSNSHLEGGSPVPMKAQLYQTIRRFVWVFPLLLVFLVPIVCLTPYLMAIQYGHVNPVFPYVSDAGGLVPQASFFSQLLDVISFFILITSYIRYKMIKHFIVVKMANSAKMSQRMLAQMHQLNFYGALTAYASAIGVVIIGNFRVTEMASGHFFGCMFAFFGMFIYMCIMSFMSYQLARCGLETKPYSMSVISITAGASLFFCLLFSMVSIYQAGFSRFFENSFRLKWTKKQDGYTTHIIATAFEWIAINTVGPFYLCIFVRMKLFQDWGKVEF